VLDPLCAAILLRSVIMAAAATALCLAIIPFWTSLLVRTYAWMFLLRDTGLFNRQGRW